MVEYIPKANRAETKSYISFSSMILITNIGIIF